MDLVTDHTCIFIGSKFIMILINLNQCFREAFTRKNPKIVWSFAKPGEWEGTPTKLLSGVRLFPWKKTEIVPNFAKKKTISVFFS